jgi:spore maturation protein CgeB
MKIGFYMKWPKGNFNDPNWNVIGDELYANSMVKALRLHPKIQSVDLYAPNYLPAIPLDIMVYMNDTEPLNKYARKHVIYMQNAYGEGSEAILKKFQDIGYDGYAFISNKLLEIHKKLNFNGIFLPFGVDTSVFYPRNSEKQYEFEISYIGNDIKGECRSTQYLLPATKYHFGLYGKWDNIPRLNMRPRLKFWKNFTEYVAALYKTPEYRRIFNKISKGKIPQEKVPVLYSSTKINLNCTHQDCVDWDVITLRTFEVLAAKGFLITDKVPVAEKIMQGCMVFTDGNEDLNNKIEYYLSHEKERAEIAEFGYNYVINNATIESRMRELVTYMESII